MKRFGDIEPGSIVIVHQHKVGGPIRMGEVLDLIGDETHRRFHVRWDDGHESIFFPAEDTVIEPAKGRHTARAR